MKKLKNSITITLLGMLFILASCGECIECEIYWKNDQGEDQINSLGEQCGEKEVTDEFEKDCLDQAQHQGRDCSCRISG